MKLTRSYLTQRSLFVLLGARLRSPFGFSNAFCPERPPFSIRRSLSTTTRTPCSFTSLAGATMLETEHDFPSQVQIALEAVRKACAITTKIQTQIDVVATITKEDASPVTVADFCSQAVILQQLSEAFPDDLYLAEETSDTMTPAVTQLIQEASGMDDEDVLKKCIDLGRTFFDAADDEGRPRVWCLDPIDGTKGFLRKEQYCVALGLLEDGIPTIGILACPNLRFDFSDATSTLGCIFVACRGKGCYQLPLSNAGDVPMIRLQNSNPKTISDPTKARFCVNMDPSFADPVGKCKDMAEYLHGGLDGEGEIIHSIRMDSQVKYGVVARGEAEFYVRLPKADHREWIWDVAPGVLVLEEIGGVVTNTKGEPLNFGEGAKLISSNGILGAMTPELHKALLEAYRQ